ncbi:MAG: RDD family protein, partial [Clostridiales bacterium]|nr:RDD family protein [Clostridiales bacterium]
LQLEELSRKEQVKKELAQISRPSLMRRLGSGILDLLFIFVLLALIELFTAAVIFRPLGYYDAQGDINTIFAESGLYLRQNGLNVTLINAYDDSKSIEENYDIPITRFYGENPRCSEKDKLAEYEQAKLDSKYYEKDESGALVRKNNVSDEDLKKFYEQQYNKAVDFLTQDPVYISAVNKTFNIMVYSILIAFLISAGTFYFLIPLLRNDGETLGQIICKMCLMDAHNIGKVRKMQVVVRSLIVVVVNFLIPFWIFIFFNHVTMITFLVTFAMMCLIKYNRSVQDFASQTVVIMKFESFRWKRSQ